MLGKTGDGPGQFLAGNTDTISSNCNAMPKSPPDKAALFPQFIQWGQCSMPLTFKLIGSMDVTGLPLGHPDTPQLPAAAAA